MDREKRVCPMCRRHPIIIIATKATTVVKGKRVEYDELSCFCSTLGEGDEDAYFIPATLMSENLLRARKAYEALREVDTNGNQPM